MDELAANPLGLHLAAIRNANATSPNRTRTLLEDSSVLVWREDTRNEVSEGHIYTARAIALWPLVRGKAIELWPCKT